MPSIGEETKLPWFAVQVRSRHENLVAALVEGKGYESFLPTYKCRRIWSDRIKQVELPLFPGYLFCRLNLQYRLPLLTTPGVLQIVGFAGTPACLDEAEIAAIQALVGSGVNSQPWPFMQIGERVRIDSGPLRGLEGVLVDFKGQHRLVLSVTLLRRSVAAEIDRAWVTPIRSYYSLPAVRTVGNPLFRESAR